MRSRRLVSVIDPVNSRETIGASSESSGLTSSVMMSDPEAARRVTRPWPISPPAPVMRTTGLRIPCRHPGVARPCLRGDEHVDGGVDDDADHQPAHGVE